MESAENQPKSSNQPEKIGDLSKIETIELLNDSIDRLEQTIKNISQDSAKLPSSESINSLLATTQELAANTITPAPEPTVTASTPPVETIAPEPVVTTPTPVETTASTQTKVETKPKSSEPKPKIVKKGRQKNLTAIILGVTAIATAVVAVFWLWLPNQQATTSITEPIVSEPTTEVVTNLNDTEPTENLSEPLTEDNITVEEVKDSSGETSDVASDEIVITPIPQDLESPAKAENLKLVEVKPKLIFTPEQTLVAALPTKISQAIKDYTDFIGSIKVNLVQSSLTVEITDDWYSLDEVRQDKLASKMLERSRQLAFNKLELKDSTGTLVARSPVIGDRIIILESSKSDRQPILDE